MIRGALRWLNREILETEHDKRVRETRACDHDWESNRKYKSANFATPGDSNNALLVSVRCFNDLKCPKCGKTWNNRCVGSETYKVDARLISEHEYDNPVTYHASAK